MTEAERAILRNQLVMMQIAMNETEWSSYSAGSWGRRVYGDLARRITETQVTLYDPSAMCTCTGRGQHIHVVRSKHLQKFACDWCDREVRRAEA